MPVNSTWHLKFILQMKWPSCWRVKLWTEKMQLLIQYKQAVISTMGFPILVRLHIYIKSSPWKLVIPLCSSSHPGASNAARGARVPWHVIFMLLICFSGIHFYNSNKYASDIMTGYHFLHEHVSELEVLMLWYITCPCHGIRDNNLLERWIIDSK